MKGTVNESKMVKQGSNENGPWVQYQVTIDGKAFSVFKDPGVSPGDMVEYETVQKGKFVNLKSITKVELPKPEPTNGTYRSKSPEEAAAINRAVALKAGLEWGKLLVDITSKAGEMPIPAPDLLRQIEAIVLRWDIYLRTGKTAPVPKLKDDLGSLPADDTPPLDAYVKDADVRF